MALTASKLHGLGNDFVVFRADALPSLEPDFLSHLAKTVCHRQFAIGGDGLIVAAPAKSNEADLRFIYYNNDGSIAEMCGNGIRCFMRFALAEGLTDKKHLRVETLAGILTLDLQEDEQIRVNMGKPRLLWHDIPFRDPEAKQQTDSASARLTLADSGEVTVWPVSMGNPHAIVFADDASFTLKPAVHGPALEVHPAFPAKTNVEFVEQLAPEHFKVTVWERGCGFTLACGTGACATMVAAKRAGKLTANIATISLPGGDLLIEWDGSPEAPVYMTGPATIVAQLTFSEALTRQILAPLQANAALIC